MDREHGLQQRLVSPYPTSTQLISLSTGDSSEKPSGEVLIINRFQTWLWTSAAVLGQQETPPLHPIISVSYFIIYCLHLNSPNSSCYSSLQPTLVQTEVVSGASNFPDVQSGPLTVASNPKNMSMVLNQNIMV